MRFKAHYIAQQVIDGKRADYWRTIDADDINSATLIAKRYRRAGYMLGLLMQEEYFHA